MIFARSIPRRATALSPLQEHWIQPSRHVFFLTDPKKLAELAHVLGVSPAVREELAADAAAFCIVSWRFDVHQRVQDDFGSCRLRNLIERRRAILVHMYFSVVWWLG